ncbi:MAG: hypothetical protein ABIB43_05430 [archaeon]
MKKGFALLGFLRGLVISILALIIILKIMNQVVGPVLWNNPTKSLSYQNFQQLSLRVDTMINSDKVITSDGMILELEPDYNILAFDYDDTKAELCVSRAFDTEFKRPKECLDGKSCLCLYKGNVEDEKVIECRMFEKTRFYSFLHKDTGESESLGCEKSGHPNTKTTYEDLMFTGLLSTHYPFVLIEVYFGTRTMYLEKEKEGDVNHILITFKDKDTKLRYKMVNKCTEESDEGCKNEHFDSVFETNKQSFVCKFDIEQDKCLAKEIDKCGTRVIKKECSCENIAYDFGFCIQDKFKPSELPMDYCYAEKIGNLCSGYNKGLLQWDDESYPYVCTFNICNIDQIGCYWDLTGGNECKTCPEKCKCDLYDEDWIKEVNPCGCDCP